MSETRPVMINNSADEMWSPSPHSRQRLTLSKHTIYNNDSFASLDEAYYKETSSSAPTDHDWDFTLLSNTHVGERSFSFNGDRSGSLGSDFSGFSPTFSGLGDAYRSSSKARNSKDSDEEEVVEDSPWEVDQMLRSVTTLLDEEELVYSSSHNSGIMSPPLLPSPLLTATPPHIHHSSSIMANGYGVDAEMFDFEEEAPVGLRSPHLGMHSGSRSNSSFMSYDELYYETYAPPSNHSTPKSRTVCKFFNAGNCKAGDSCKYSHEMASSAPLGLPSPSLNSGDGGSSIGSDDTQSQGSTDSSGSPGSTVCKFYAAGYCRKGDRCTFKHESSSGTTSTSANAAPAAKSPSPGTSPRETTTRPSPKSGKMPVAEEDENESSRQAKSAAADSVRERGMERQELS